MDASDKMNKNEHGLQNMRRGGKEAGDFITCIINQDNSASTDKNNTHTLICP